MIIPYYPHSKNIHNLKLQNLKTLENSNYVSKSPNFKSLTTCKWGVIYMTFKTKL